MAIFRALKETFLIPHTHTVVKHGEGSGEAPWDDLLPMTGTWVNGLLKLCGKEPFIFSLELRGTIPDSSSYNLILIRVRAARALEGTRVIELRILPNGDPTIWKGFLHCPSNEVVNQLMSKARRAADQYLQKYAASEAQWFDQLLTPGPVDTWGHLLHQGGVQQTQRRAHLKRMADQDLQRKLCYELREQQHGQRIVQIGVLHRQIAQLFPNSKLSSPQLGDSIARLIKDGLLDPCKGHPQSSFHLGLLFNEYADEYVQARENDRKAVEIEVLRRNLESSSKNLACANRKLREVLEEQERLAERRRDIERKIQELEARVAVFQEGIQRLTTM